VYDRQGNIIDVCQYAQAQTNPLTGNWLNDKPAQKKADIHHYSFYDARGLKIAEIDGEGYVKEYFYNDSGLLQELCAYEKRTATRVIDPLQSFELYRPQNQTNGNPPIFK
jgi:hypothetical protein